MPTVSDIRKSLSSTPPGFEEIAGAAKAQLKALDVFFTAQMPQFEPQMRKSVTYCLKNRGKRLRPLLVFFCGAKKSAKVDEALVRLAATIELVHLATLVHDDVMDEADLRHGTSTLNALSGPTIAVLLGDSLFAHALELAADFDSESICKPLTRAARRVCAGEV